MFRDRLLFSFLRERAGERTKRVLAAAILAGAFEGATILIVGLAIDDLRGGEISFRNLGLFVLSLYGYYRCYSYAIGNFTSIALDIVQDLQLRITAAFRRLNLRRFEQLDKGEVYQEIIGSKDMIVESTRYVVVALSGLVLMLVAFLFALILSPVGFVVIVSSLGLSGFLLSKMHGNVMTLQRRVQALDQAFTLSLKDLLNGFTELKVSRRKRDELFDAVIEPRAAESFGAKRESEQLYVRGLSFFNSFVFVPVGALLFVLPGFVEMPVDVLVKLIGVTLFSIGPLTSIITALPALSKAELQIRSVLAFEERLKTLREDEAETAESDIDFQRIEIRDCRFVYDQPNGGPQFSIEIEEFSLAKNEFVFVTGGNGSGKTSLMKLFAGLYTPQSGTISVDGVPVRAVGIDTYRGLFSIVLLNFHLFERLYGISGLDERYGNTLLSEMQIEDRVRIEDGQRFSTTDLSSGQRKRLALIAALLEKRPILLFDEVAADFDPVFRRFFYEEFLPGLKREGRTILAISHDDRFYHLADRVVTMRDGRIVSDDRQPERVA